MSKFVSTIAVFLLGASCTLSIGFAQDSKKYVVTPQGARPSPNYSAGVHVGDTLYVSGQTGSDPKTQKDLFPRMNTVYTTIFKDPRPTRTTVGVSKLAAAGAHIEITVTARK
jgi:enamine deaminase RidA (YjgF/YER057c/UK114 family)